MKYDGLLLGLWAGLVVWSAATHEWGWALYSLIGTMCVAGDLCEMKCYRSKVEIRSRDGKDLYLTRYFLFGHTFSRYAVMLHHMHQPDDDACHHDHPWPFITVVLKGGYVEEVSGGTITRDREFKVATAGGVQTVHMTPGTVRYRPATHTHRIAALPTGSCWTLVFRGSRQRSWGFHTDEGWVWYDDFIRTRKAVAWCEEKVMRGYRWLDEKRNKIEVPADDR